MSAQAAAPIIEQVDKLMEEIRADDKVVAAKAEVEKFNKNPKNKKKQAEVPENSPYTDAVDDNGDETGEIEFNFGANASGKNKKTGKTWTRTIKLWDSKKKEFKGAVWSGSKIKVAYTIGTYFINAKVGYGVKLYLESVQIIELVQGGNRSADGYGFGEEEGFEAEETSDDSSDTGAEGGDGTEADDTPDF